MSEKQRGTAGGTGDRDTLVPGRADGGKSGAQQHQVAQQPVVERVSRRMMQHKIKDEVDRLPEAAIPTSRTSPGGSGAFRSIFPEKDVTPHPLGSPSRRRTSVRSRRTGHGAATLVAAGTPEKISAEEEVELVAMARRLTHRDVMNAEEAAEVLASSLHGADRRPERPGDDVVLARHAEDIRLRRRAQQQQRGAEDGGGGRDASSSAPSIGSGAGAVSDAGDDSDTSDVVARRRHQQRLSEQRRGASPHRGGGDVDRGNGIISGDDEDEDEDAAGLDDDDDIDADVEGSANVLANDLDPEIDQSRTEHDNTTRLMNSRTISHLPEYLKRSQFDFHRVRIDRAVNPLYGDDEHDEICALMVRASAMRELYVDVSLQEMRMDLELEPLFTPEVPRSSQELLSRIHAQPMPNASSHVFESVDGVFHVWESEQALEQDSAPVTSLPRTLNQYYRDMVQLLKLMADGPVKSWCFRRLRLLEARFNLHLLLNEDIERVAQKHVPHRDLYNVAKIDTHVHHSASMNQKHLLSFIKSKLREAPDDVVIHRDGRDLTLKQVFESLDLTAEQLNVDTLDVHADKKTFHRFDRFNLKYNPVGESRLREVFLKTDNKIQGRYMAELTSQLIEQSEQASRYQMTEWRLSIYGRSRTEWDKLAAWVIDNGLVSLRNRWIIQVPRLYSVHRKANTPGIKCFKDMLDNIFGPLFEVTQDPSSHPKLHLFLKCVSGFDSVDDESRPELKFKQRFPPPQMWTKTTNPPFSYYTYYMWANLKTLNQFRKLRGLRRFSFRPHSGEAGDVEHLACTFLNAHSINHGINLRRSPVLQYLYWYQQIGLAVSPISNNSLFLRYAKNPLPEFLRIGMNVSLSTDDPLQFHFTHEPLMEEYTIAAQVWKLSPVDMCELARNSVYQSGFEHWQVQEWLGSMYTTAGVASNDITKTNVPNVRLMFRHEILRDECNMLTECARRFQDALDAAEAAELPLIVTGIKSPPPPVTGALLRAVSATRFDTPPGSPGVERRGIGKLSSSPVVPSDSVAVPPSQPQSH